MGIIERVKQILHLEGAPDPSTGSRPSPVVPAQNAAPSPVPSPASVEPEELSRLDGDLNQFVTELVRNQQPVVAGSIELLGLDYVKHELGARWERVASQVRDIAQAEIKRYLSETDHFRPQGDARFVICFGALGRQQAAERATLISRAIKARLLDELPEIDEETSVNRFVTEVDPGNIATGERSLADRLAATLEKMQCEVELSAARQRRMILKDFQLFFSPVWQVERQATSFNRVVVDRSLIGRALKKIEALGDEMQVRKTIAEIDCMTLARAIERLHRVQRANRSAALLVPVSFETFLASITSRDYMRLLGSVPLPYRERIVLEIGDIGQNITIAQMHALSEKLKKHVGKLAAEVDINSPLLPMFSPGDVYGLACVLSEMSDHSPDRLASFIDLAGEARAVTFAHSANTLGLASAAIEAGFQHVDGPAVHLNTTDPRPAMRLKPMVNLAVTAKAARAVRAVSGSSFH